MGLGFRGLGFGAIGLRFLGRGFGVEEIFYRVPRHKRCIGLPEAQIPR